MKSHFFEKWVVLKNKSKQVIKKKKKALFFLKPGVGLKLLCT
jgi:hypothetical protein